MIKSNLIRTYACSVSIIFGVCACNNPTKNTSKGLLPDAPKHITISWEQELAEAQRDHEIYGAFDISPDTVLLLRRSRGIELSSDQGRNWTWMGKEIFRLDEFMVDDKGTWWGLERWKGIHEPSYCRMYSSKDAGKTWKRYVLNTNVFFPYHISSQPHQPLEAVDFWSKKLYRLPGSNPLARWTFLEQLPDSDNTVADLSVGPYAVSRETGNNKLYVKRPNGSADTLLSFTKASDIYCLTRRKDMIYAAGPDTSDKSSYFAIIKNERLLKDITIPGVDLNITVTRFGHVYLTCTEGAFEYKDDRLVPIFR